MLLVGLERRRLSGRVLIVAGAAMIARAATRAPARRLFGLRACDAVELHKSIVIEAPRERVVAFFGDFENVPRFMEHVDRIESRGDGKWQWVVRASAGVPVRWDVDARFEDAPGGGTRIDLRVSYRPVAGAIGHAVATLLGANPKRALDEDMLRLKSLLERGKTSAHGHTVTRDEFAHPPARSAPPPV